MKITLEFGGHVNSSTWLKCWRRNRRLVRLVTESFVSKSPSGSEMPEERLLQ